MITLIHVPLSFKKPHMSHYTKVLKIVANNQSRNHNINILDVYETT